jgi:hypothetical protein
LIVLLTDGGNTAVNTTPSIASETVDALSIKIYIIGIDKREPFISLIAIKMIIYSLEERRKLFRSS